MKTQKSHFGINNILFKYLARLFLKNLGIVFVVFSILILMISHIEVIRKFPSCQYGTLAILTIYRTFFALSIIFPLVVFIGTVLFFIELHKRSELTIIKCAGIAAHRIVLFLISLVSIAWLTYVTAIDGLAAFSIGRIKTIEAKLVHPTREKPTFTNNGIWLRDAKYKKSYIIHINQFDKKTNKATRARFFEFDENNNFKSSIFAETAEISSGFWILKNSKTISSDNAKSTSETVKIPTVYSTKNINQFMMEPKCISFFDAPKYISMLKKINQINTRLKAQWFFRLSSILQMLSLTLLAVAFCLNCDNRNFNKFRLRVLILFCCVFPIYLLNSIMMALGENGSLPIWLAALVVPVTISASCCKRALS